MLFHVKPVQRLFGSVHLPASKSYSIRAFFVAACGGSSSIFGASNCDDARVALRIARSLGAKVVSASNGVRLSMPEIREKQKMLDIDVGESGTSLRFVLPLLPHFTAAARVTGRGTLLGRPNHHLCAALRARRLMIRGQGPGESVPVMFNGGEVPSGLVRVDGSVSSQFVSALMIAAPLAGQDTRLCITGKQLVSQDYVTMTRQILARAGIRVVSKGRREFLVRGGQKFQGLKEFVVPSDEGLAAFFVAAAALVRSDVVLRGCFDDCLTQSDGAMTGLFRSMGVAMERTPESIHVKGPCVLRGGTFSLRNCPDLVPVMAVTAMFARGVTRLKGIAHARVKESDRISDLRRELLKVGADIDEKKDELIIRPVHAYRAGVTLDPHQDHRLAMAFAVLGLRVGVKIRDMGCTSKSYPGFSKDIASLCA